MTTLAPQAQSRCSFGVALGITLAMGIAITVIDVLQPSEPLFSILAFIPGVVSILALRASGLSREGLYLRFARISTPGLLALAAATVLLLPILASSTGWSGWRWLPALLYAPASGIAQEIYFRGALLPAFEHVLRGKQAIVLHNVVFVGYHFRTFCSVPSLPVAALVAVVLFAAGYGWAWQVQRDCTIFWSTAQHSLFLILMSMFEWV